MFFSFFKRKNKLENKEKEINNKQQIKEDYDFIHLNYIKAIATDNDITPLFSYQKFSSSYTLTFSKDMTPTEIKCEPITTKHSNIKTYSNSSNNSNKRRYSNDNREDDYIELYQKHLSGDVCASRRIGLKPRR